MLIGGQLFKSQCYDGQGLGVDGRQPSAMDDDIVHRPKPKGDCRILFLYFFQGDVNNKLNVYLELSKYYINVCVLLPEHQREMLYIYKV